MLELAAALLPDSERCPDLFVALRRLPAHAVAADYHIPVALWQQLQHVPDHSRLLTGDRILRRVGSAVVGHQVTQRRAVFADRLVQGGRRAGGPAQRLDGVDAQPGALCDGGNLRRAEHRRPQLILRAAHGGELASCARWNPDQLPGGNRVAQ